LVFYYDSLDIVLSLRDWGSLEEHGLVVLGEGAQRAKCQCSMLNASLFYGCKGGFYCYSY